MNIEIDFIPTHRQHLAWSYLQDKTTTHILYGGSVGSGKSYLGCMWVFISCIMYPGVNALVDFSIVGLLYGMFRLYVKLEFMEHEITGLVRTMALRSNMDEKK